MPDELNVFSPFPKIPRLKREVIITEKIDGTNAQVIVREDGTVLAGSRTRFITPEDDNYGFARWVQQHEDELRTGLGIGQHFGEWWGCGIQRKYDLSERRFSLFNVGRWKDGTQPACCHVVPMIHAGRIEEVDDVLDDLRKQGSHAVPSFMRPEGIIVYHSAARSMFKVLLENDDTPKGNA